MKMQMEKKIQISYDLTVYVEAYDTGHLKLRGIRMIVNEAGDRAVVPLSPRKAREIAAALITAAEEIEA